MSNVRERAGALGVAFAGGVFKIALYVCIIVLIFWLGKSSYEFGYDVFNQRAVSPENGQEVTVVIKEGTSVYEIGKILERKGLIEDAKVFWVQELLSSYRGKMKAGTYLLSTAYTPNRMMEILSGIEEGTAS